jgi:hypothetical protein
MNETYKGIDPAKAAVFKRKEEIFSLLPALVCKALNFNGIRLAN